MLLAVALASPYFSSVRMLCADLLLRPATALTREGATLLAAMVLLLLCARLCSPSKQAYNVVAVCNRRSLLNPIAYFLHFGLHQVEMRKV